MRKWLFNNSLTLAFLLLFLATLTGQTITGWKEYNNERQMEESKPPVKIGEYFRTGHFIEATFENWESEFLQMGMFVLATIWLKQKGSSESKKFDGTDDVDREPSARRKDAPWPVKRGGIVLWLYSRSLTIAFFLLFALSVLGHFHGSLMDENEKQAALGLPAKSWTTFIGDSRFWFESLQNWQSEFLSVLAIAVLPIFLRQRGSPQSKPVDAPDHETGE